MAVPTDYRRLAYWFKADALALADGTAVTQLTDSSGKARHITQATAGNQATAQTVSGVKVVRFDGTDDFYSLAAYDLTKRSRITVYAVFRMAANTVPSASHTLIEHSANPATTTGGWGVTVDIYNRVNGTIKNAVSGTCVKRSRARVGSDFVIATVEFDLYQPREQAWVLVNGREEWSRTPSNSSSPVHGLSASSNPWGQMRSDTLYVGMRAGTSLPFAGDLAELIVYEERQKPSVRFDIEDYLAAKYAITDRVEREDIRGIYLHDGVSFNEGAPAAPIESWANYLMRNSKHRWIWANIANQGRTVREQWEDAQVEHDAWKDTEFDRRVVIFDPGSNDIHYIVSDDANATNATALAYAWHGDYANDLIADGWDVIEMTGMDRGDFAGGTPADFATQMGNYNASLRTDAPARGSTLADIGLGNPAGETRFSNAADTIYFNVDAVHQSDIGYRVQAEVMAPAYESVGFDLLPFGAMGTVENQTPLKFWFSAEQVRTFPVGANAPQHLDDKSLYLINTPRSWNHGTAASRPTVLHSALNGLPALRFNGSSHALQTSGPIDLSVPSSLVIFIVVAAITSGDAGIILELGTNSDAATTGFKVEHLANNHVKATIVGDVGTSDFETSSAVTGACLLTVILNKGAASNEATVLINGAAESGTRANNANNTNGFASGSNPTLASRNTSSQFLGMDLCEVVGYGPAFGTADRQEWEQYLCTKYGLTWAG